MGVQRRQWADLPDKVRAAVVEHTGPVTKVKAARGGLNSGIAATVHSLDGAVFVKGLPLGHPQAWTQDREAAIAPHLAEAAPRLLWQIRVGGWNLLGWEHVEGRHADYTPGSPDLPAVADALALLGKAACPGDVPVKTVERWRDYVDAPSDLDRLDGDALLHTDPNSSNVLVGDGGRTLLVDWAWPTRAAAWVDAACWVVWLITADHTPAEAEQHAATVPAWQQGDDDALAVFARVQSRLWAGIAEADPNPWTVGVAQAAARWKEHRT
ncbi:hypothetical protein HDA32_003196 [Spinactinospora alkalitolerans]|uniref:Aminoglycoside phosphotransferase n=1 Tax=Spinactinospora alkalitolerans TaxID=687207 RepID=A0A852TUF8_9ACTN|nr:aminoglycoside phosphotransferase [Spinactinospora alkalitolerans]NYE48076.1 hypothetical protein [Spinactinospora alkalitolerans]